MDGKDIIGLLEAYKSGKIGEEQAIEILKKLPFENLGFARIDHHREMRKGMPEVIFGQGKTPAEILEIVRVLHQSRSNILVTRTNEETYTVIRNQFTDAQYNSRSGTITIRQKHEYTGKGTVLVLAAGTADIPVAEEAAVTSDLFGNRTETLYDVGVAGLHRLLAEREKLASARIIIVVAGMEGALPSVVAGMVSVPVIAVPTSVGYGTHFQGVAPLLSMLNSCSGLAVVNIDNGFGAGQLASIINHLK